MDGIEFFPSLSYCIETAAREEFWNSVNQYMEGGQEDRKLKDKIELLKAFLESMDFKKLRSQSERHLVEGKQVKFVICWKEGKPSYEMMVTEESED
jgi:N-glycosylase/DNA lyase